MKRFCLFAVLAALTVQSLDAVVNDYDQLKLPPYILGLATHAGHRTGDAPDDLTILKSIGFNAVRDDFGWSQCEYEKGVYRFLPEYQTYLDGIKTSGLLFQHTIAYGNRFYDDGDRPRSPEAVAAYCGYAEYITGKTNARIQQIWNEWEGVTGLAEKYHNKGDVASYIKLLQAAAPRVRKADPQALILGNSICRSDAVIEEYLKGGILDYCDIFALNPYNYTDGKDKNTPEALYKRLQNIDGLLRKYNQGKEVPTLITEVNWPVQLDNFGVTPATNADYLGRFLLLSRTLPFIKGVWCYDLHDDGWDTRYNEHNYGVTRPDYTPKPAYSVLADLAADLPELKFVSRLESKVANVEILRFRKGDRDYLAAWSTEPDRPVQIILKKDNPAPLTVSLRRLGEKELTRNWGYRDWASSNKNPMQPELFSLTAGTRPVILEGKLGEITVDQIIARPFAESLRPANLVLSIPAVANFATAKTEPQNFIKATELKAAAGQSFAGDADLGMEFAVQYDAGALYLTVKVNDDVFCQKEARKDIWKGDSIQFAAAFPRNGVIGEDRTEFSMAFMDGKPVIYRNRIFDNSAAPGWLDKTDLAIDIEAAKTQYTVTLPVAMLGIKALKKGDVIAFSILVNDNDGAGRKGYSQWGSGIGNAAGPTQYGMLVLQ